MTGYTYSPDFPVTPGAYDTTRGGLDAFVTKFAPDGASLVYSTFLGGIGREQGQGIAVDASGNAYVTGLTESADNPFTPEVYDGFPVTPGAFQTTGSFDAFVTKLNPQGSALVYSSYLGGSAASDRGWAIAVDNAGSAYVAGDSQSMSYTDNFPVVNAVQPNYGGGLSDAFVSKVNPTGTALVYSTYLGGNGFDEGRGIALDGSGSAYITGDTSAYDFPVTAGAFQMQNGGGLNNHDDAFVVKIGATGPAPTPTPTPAPTATLSSLTLNPTSVTGGTSTQGTVTLSSAAPTGGAIVTLSSSNAAVASVAPSVIVAAGVTSANFTIITSPVTKTKSVTISAAFGGLTRTALLTVRPTDTVTLQRPEYLRSRKLVSVDATSTDATATLKVYVTATGALIGTLKIMVVGSTAACCRGR